MLRQLPNGLGDLRQLGVHSAALQPQTMINSRSAADHGSWGYVLGNATLRDGDGSVSNFYVAAYAYLSRENYVVADVGRTCQADLGAQKCVVSDGAAVSDVDHVVDF